jgi:ParB family transcriptional regulator, chromosome partitioning protein
MRYWSFAQPSAKLKREAVRSRPRSLCDLLFELTEIDENISRANLSTAEQAIAVARRKAIYEELHPGTSHRAPGVSRQIGDTRERSENERFTAATAVATGKAERNIQRAAARGEAFGDDLGAVTGTSLDKGVERDALASGRLHI